MKRRGWDRLVLPNGWIAIWVGVAVLWATGFVVTADVFWAVDLLGELWDKLQRAV